MGPRMFASDPREGILHIDMMIGLANFHLYVERRVFIEGLDEESLRVKEEEEEEGSNEEEREPKRFAWQQWGPRRSRMMGADIRMQRQWCALAFFAMSVQFLLAHLLSIFRIRFIFIG